MSVHKLTDGDISKLAENKENIVYRWGQLPTPEKILTLEEIKQLREEIWEAFSQLKRGRTTLSMKQVLKARRLIKEMKPEWEAFSRSHPLIFDGIVASHTTDREMEAMQEMSRLKQLVKEGKISDVEGRARLQAYIMSTFAVPEAEYRRLNPDKNITPIGPPQ